jgi:hypothetical protein
LSYFVKIDNHGGGGSSYIDEDEKKSLAIVNLQAMLGLEDVD